MSSQTLPDVSELSKQIMTLIEPMPREKKNSFSAHKSRARKKAEKAKRPITEEEAIIAAAIKMGIYGAENPLASDTGLATCEVPPPDPTSNLNGGNELSETLETSVMNGANSYSYSGGRETSEEQVIPRNVINFPPQAGTSSRLPPAAVAEAAFEQMPESSLIGEVDKAEATATKTKVSGIDDSGVQRKYRIARNLDRLFSHRYLLFKLVCYSALVPASSKAVHAFFQGLDLYGNETANLVFAVILTASVDLIAIDMLTRAAAQIKNRWQWSAFGLLFLSLAVIALNIGLAFKNMSNDASLDARAKSEREWQDGLTKKETELSQANEAYAVAQGNYLSTKWAGNPDPKACEEGSGTCRGPFITRSVSLQSEVLAAEAKKMEAQASFDKIKSEKPVDGAAISKGVLDLRIWFYSVLWGFIIMASIASPRRKAY